MSRFLYKIGIDEVGRGPVAGPVAVGVFCYKVSDEDFLRKELVGMNDSKKLSEKKRKLFFEKIKALKNKTFLEKKRGEDFLAEKYSKSQNFEKINQKNTESFSLAKKKEVKVFCSVVFVSAGDIDKFGIVPSIQKALDCGLENILENLSSEDFSKLKSQREKITLKV